MNNKIVLFDSNIKYVGVPLALLSITKLLDTKKYDIHIITKTEYSDYESEILKHCENALCFGLTVITGTPTKTAIKISQLIKNKYPSLPIIWGGWQAITLPDISLENPYIDYLCIGQGEKTFCEFINMIQNNDFENIGKIKGLSYKKNGCIVHNQPREIEDLNLFPDFDLGLINWKKYLEVTDYGMNALRFVTSYGCAHRCGFCCEPLNSKRRWKALSSERMINFLSNLRKVINFDSLIIVDNNFFTDEQRVINFCKGLIENDFDIKFGQVNGRTNELIKYKDSTWDLLQHAGLYNILIGAESANNETLKLINKGATVEDTILLNQICKKYSIKLVVSVMLGLPTKHYFDNERTAFSDEFKEIYEFYKYLYEIDQYIRLLVFVYTPLPSTPMYDKAIELGFTPPQNLEEWSNYELTDIHIPWVERSKIHKVKMLGYITTLLGLDFKYFFRDLPFRYKLLSMPLVSIIIFITKLRLKYDFLSIPIDLKIFNMSVRVFRYINRNKSIARIGN